MTSISKIISENGGIDMLRLGMNIHVVNCSGASLEIEYVAPEGKGDLVTVWHRDPQAKLLASMQFEVNEFGWLPRVSLDPCSLKESHVYTAHGTDVKLYLINFQLQRRLEEVARQWDETIKQQGFVLADEKSKYYPLFSPELLLAAGMETY